MLPMYFLGGIQILCIGMLGEYLGKVYAEVKSRPRFFIEKTVLGVAIVTGTTDRPEQPVSSRV